MAKHVAENTDIVKRKEKKDSSQENKINGKNKTDKKRTERIVKQS